MTISNVTAASLGTLIAEFGAEYFGRGINQRAPLLKSGALKKTDPDGEEYVATLYPSANHSTGFLLDFGRLPVGGSGAPVKARALPSVLMSRLEQGRAAAKLKLADRQRTKLLDQEMKERAADCGRILNRALIGGSINPQAGATWSGTAANSTVTVPFLDVSLFREGMAVDFIDVSATLAYTVRVTGVAFAAIGANSANVAGNVSFINDVVDPATNAVIALGATAVATGDSFLIRGSTAGFGAASTLTGAVCNSFDTMTGSSPSASFMGQDPATMGVGYNWRGNYLSLGAAYSQEAMMAFASHIGTVGDDMPDVAVCHNQTAAAHKASGDFHGAAFGVTAGISASRTGPIEKSLDKYGNVYEDDGLRMAGAKVIQDPSCQIGRIIFFNSESTRLCVWAEIGPDMEAGDPQLLGRTFYTTEVQFSGLYNLVTAKRSSTGILDGITGF
jgi:hypothetical protein